MSALFEGLNDKQLKAVTHTDGPLLIVAGAGTGKTTVITRRIAYLLEQKLAEPNQVLALTFTEKAALEMEERVDLLLPLGSYDLWISTFHSFCERMLKQHGLHIGLPNDFKLLDQTSQWIFIHNNFDKFDLDYYKPLGSPNRFIDALLDHFSKCKDELISPEDYIKYANEITSEKTGARAENDEVNESEPEANRIKELAHAYSTYQKLMLDNNYLDFADLISYSIELLKRRPNIRKHYAEQFKYVMVDEFQDTNVAQYELIKLLVSKPETEPINLVVVGDDDQSIYKFRGASVSNILKIKGDFPDLKELTLLDNYRSSQDILDLAYNFIQANNPNRLESQLHINKRLKGHNKKHGIIQVIEGKDLNEEINLVVGKVLSLKSENPDSSWNDYAILIRANSSAGEIIPVLEAKQIPFNYVANRGLYKKPLIADIINYLKLLDNYHESTSLYRVLNFPKFHIPARELAHISQYTNRKAVSLYEALHEKEALEQVSESSQKKLSELIRLLDQHTKSATAKSAVELFVQLVSDLEIDELLAEDTLENAQNRELLEQFYKRVENYTQEHEDRTMRGYINFLKLEQDAGEEGSINFDPSSGPESLKLMTIHSAKGLEFEYVFIIGMVDQRFPSRGQKDPIEIPEKLVKDILPEGDFHLQEERRLFYVAITRAKTHLYLSWAKNYGGARAKKPSLFLIETGLVPSDTVHKATGKVIFTPAKPSSKKIVYRQLPEKFSYSQIATFLQCPLEYKYRYYLRLPLPGSHYFSFGSTIHCVLERYVQRHIQQRLTAEQGSQTDRAETKFPPQELLLELYDREWQDDWYKDKKQKEEYRERGKAILKTFYEMTIANNPTPKFVEMPFTLRLGKDNQYLFNGKIDRADSSEKGLLLMDYKTSEKVPSKAASSDIDQLRIYQLACEEFLKQEVAGLQYWYLVPNQVVNIPLANEIELAKLKSELSETIEEIRDAVKYDRFAELHKKSSRHQCTHPDLL